MDLAIALAEYGITENVSSDLSTYQNMVDGWRGSMEIPTETELQAAYDNYLLNQMINNKSAQLKQEMYRVLVDGFQWRETNAGDWFTVSIDDDMQGFLTRTLLKLNEGRVSPHGGFIRSNGVNTLIDDIGMRELCVFAGTWGDAISAVRIQEIEAIVDWDAFDPYAVDWSVNWSGADASNGWNDNTLTQTP